jgi:hypothetical protein
MRLSIAIVFLIGAMLATEVIGSMELEAAKLRTWFNQTLERLTRGQTLQQNREFIIVTLLNANRLLRLLSYQKLVVEMPDDDIVSQDGVYRYLIESDKVLINEIVEVDNVPPPSNDRAIVHVKYLLRSVKDVLRGDLKSAREEVYKSESIFEYSLTPDDEKEFNTVTGLPGSPHAGDVAVGVESPHYIDGSVNKTSSIRTWLKLRLMGLEAHASDQDPWMVMFLMSVSEIAQALVNSLGSNLPPVVLTFIGRYPVEELSVIANRIVFIKSKIISSIGDVLGMRFLLNAIVHILSLDFVAAKRVLKVSNEKYPYNLNPSDKSFNAEMSGIYHLCLLD